MKIHEYHSPNGAKNIDIVTTDQEEKVIKDAMANLLKDITTIKDPLNKFPQH